MRERRIDEDGVLQICANEKRVLRCEARLARIRSADMVDVIVCLSSIAARIHWPLDFLQVQDGVCRLPRKRSLIGIN